MHSPLQSLPRRAALWALVLAVCVTLTGCVGLTERKPIYGDHDGNPATPEEIVDYEDSILGRWFKEEVQPEIPDLIEDTATGNIPGVAWTGVTLAVALGGLYVRKRRKEARAKAETERSNATA